MYRGLLKGKGKVIRYSPGVAQRVARVTALLFHDLGTRRGGGEWSAARPGRTLPPGKTRYPLYSASCWLILHGINHFIECQIHNGMAGIKIETRIQVTATNTLKCTGVSQRY